MSVPSIPPVKQLATGFEFLEGPVWIDPSCAVHALLERERGALVFNDIPASCSYWWSDGETGVFRTPTGQANGSALDAGGHLLTCEHEHRRVSRTDGDGRIVVIADRYDGKRLNSPNDVTVRGDGRIYFTDPPYGVAQELRELPFQGLFRVDAAGAPPVLLADDFEKPNGLAFSVDQQTLYVADTERGHVRAFRCDANGDLSDSRLFCEAERPDGLRIDVAGNVYIAAMAGLQVVDSNGRTIAEVPMPERPANLAFGGDDGRDLFVCARTGLYAARTELPGAASGA